MTAFEQFDWSAIRTTEFFLVANFSALLIVLVKANQFSKGPLFIIPTRSLSVFTRRDPFKVVIVCLFINIIKLVGLVEQSKANQLGNLGK